MEAVTISSKNTALTTQYDDVQMTGMSEDHYRIEISRLKRKAGGLLSAVAKAAAVAATDARRRYIRRIARTVQPPPTAAVLVRRKRD